MKALIKSGLRYRIYIIQRIINGCVSKNGDFKFAGTNQANKIGISESRAFFTFAVAF